MCVPAGRLFGSKLPIQFTEYDPVPPLIVSLAVPSLPPKQLTSVVVVVTVIWFGWLIIIESLIWHPLTSITL